MRTQTAIFLAIAVSGLSACWIEQEVPIDEAAADSDRDADSSTDADSDGDSDADTDSDSGAESGSDSGSDADGDSDTDSACPESSGWPCSCAVEGDVCDDGADCIGITGLEAYGAFCAAQCGGYAGSCPPAPYEATAECALTDGTDSFWCVLLCTAVDQCPPDQECVDTGQGVSICL